MAAVQFRLEPFAEDHREAWDHFVAKEARNSHFMHSRKFLDYHRDRFVDHSLMLYRGGKLSAILPAHREGDTLASHRGLTFGGWLVNHRFRLADWFEAFDHLVDHARREGMDTLDYRPTPPWYHRVPGEEDIYWFERQDPAAVRSVVNPTSLIRIPAPARPSENRRHELRQAKKNGFRVTSGGDLITPIMALVEETLDRRHGARPVHTTAEMEELRRRFPDHIRGYAVEQEGRLVAAIIILVDDACLKLQYVGYAPDQPPGAMELIYDHLFHQAEFRNRWFDFGTSSTGEDLDDTLFAYKESYGARLGLYRRYTLHLDSR